MAKSRIHSVLTALPVLMLVAGLYVYYRAEQAQVQGDLLLAEQVILTGEYQGLSEVKSLSESRYFFWLSLDAHSRGARIETAQWVALKMLSPALEKGEVVQMTAAPRVSGSKTVWVVAIERDGQPLPEAVPGQLASGR